MGDPYSSSSWKNKKSLWSPPSSSSTSKFLVNMENESPSNRSKTTGRNGRETKVGGRNNNNNNNNNQQQHHQQQHQRQLSSSREKRNNNNNNNNNTTKDSSSPSSFGGERSKASQKSDYDFDYYLDAKGYGKNKRKVIPANHLLNFTFPVRNSSSSSSVTSSRNRSMKKSSILREKFVQANYRVAIGKNKSDYCYEIDDPDIKVEWEDVELVFASSRDSIQCPICLETPVLPKITLCGHIYCWHCILQYMATGEDVKTWKKCPICFEMMCLKNLKSVVIEQLPALSDGEMITFELLQRAKDSIVALPKVSWTPDLGYRWPFYKETGAIYARLLIVSDLNFLLEKESKELDDAIQVARSALDESIPYLFQAKTLLEEKREEYITNGGLKKEQEFLVTSSLPTLKVIPTEEKNNFNIPDMTSPHSVWDDDEDTTTKNSSIAKDKEEIPSTFQSKSLLNSAPSDGFVYIYQEKRGQLIFLHPLNVKMLLYEYETYENFPTTLTAPIKWIEEITVTEEFRKRYKFLRYLPLSSTLAFCEVDLKDLISESSISHFKSDIQRREEQRRQEAEAKNKETNRKKNELYRELRKAAGAEDNGIQIFYSSQSSAISSSYNYYGSEGSEGSGSWENLSEEDFLSQSPQSPPVSQSPPVWVSEGFHVHPLLNSTPEKNTTTTTTTTTTTNAPFLDALKAKKNPSSSSPILQPITTSSKARPGKKDKGKTVMMLSNSSHRKY